MFTQNKITQMIGMSFGQDSGLGMAEKCLLLTISTFAKPTNTGKYAAKVPIKVLSSMTGLAHSTISAKLASLKEKDYVRVKKSQECNIYYLHVAKIEHNHNLWLEYMMEHEKEELSALDL